MSPDDPHLDIRYYRDPFSRELPTDISISMGMQEWECFLEKGVEIVNNMKKSKHQFLVAPIQGDKEICFL